MALGPKEKENIEKIAKKLGQEIKTGSKALKAWAPIKKNVQNTFKTYTAVCDQGDKAATAEAYKLASDILKKCCSGADIKSVADELGIGLFKGINS